MKNHKSETESEETGGMCESKNKGAHLDTCGKILYNTYVNLGGL